MAHVRICLNSAITTNDIHKMLAILNEAFSGNYLLSMNGEKVEIKKQGDDQVLLGFDIPVQGKGFSYAYTDMPMNVLTETLKNVAFAPIFGKFKEFENLQGMRKFVQQDFHAKFGSANWDYPADQENTDGVQRAHEGAIEGYSYVVMTKDLKDEMNLQRRAFSFDFTKSGAIPLKIEGYLTATKNLPKDAPFMFYISSGGYILDCSKHEAKLMERISSESNTRVFTVKYPLAPEHAIEDINQAVKIAYQWVKENAALLNKDNDSPFILAGFSAGAGLATYIAAQETDKQFIDKLLLASPFIGLSEEHLDKCSIEDTMLTRNTLDMCIQHAIGLTSPKDPQMFPIYDENIIMPSTVLLAGETDSLRPVTEGFHKKLINNNQDATFHLIGRKDPNRPADHCFFAWGDANPQVYQMISDVEKTHRLKMLKRLLQPTSAILSESPNQIGASTSTCFTPDLHRHIDSSALMASFERNSKDDVRKTIKFTD